MTPAGTLALYCLIIAGASLTGGWLPSRWKLTHTRMQVIMSFVSGLMLGVALFHMLPHGSAKLRSFHDGGYWMAGGILGMFLLIRVFHVHSHGEAGTDCDGAPHGHGHRASGFGVLAGLTIHSLLDGIALAAAVTADARFADSSMFFGIATFIAVLAHKPLDSLSISSVMAAGGWSVRTRALVNLLYAVTVPIGATLFAFGMRDAGDATVGAALCFAAGLFLCIALADLLPEIQFHDHDRLKLTVALLVGLAFAFAIDAMHPHEGQRTSPLVERMTGGK
ncbi:MAG: ZIP family metal transporter [Planctomycetota bacterium]